MAANPLALLGGVGAVALGVVGGLYVTGSGTAEGNAGGNSEDTRNEWFSLYEDDAYKTVSGDTVTVKSPYKDNYGETYSKYLVGKNSKSDKWWKQTFKNEFVSKQPTLHDKFRKLKEGEKQYTDLKNLCDEAYKNKVHNSSPDNNGKIKASVATDSDDDFQESNIWQFCSPFGAKPTTLQEATTAVANVEGSSEEKGYASATGSSKFGEKLKTSLISTFDPKNNSFWAQRDKEFKNETTPSTGASLYFAKSKDKTIRDLCREAYGKTAPGGTETATDPVESNVQKYCTLTGK